MLKYQVKTHGIEATIALDESTSQIQIEAPANVREILERLILDGYRFGGISASMEASPSDLSEDIHRMRSMGLDIDLIDGIEPSDPFDNAIVS